MDKTVHLYKAWGIRINKSWNKGISEMQRIIKMTTEGKNLEESKIDVLKCNKYHMAFDSNIIVDVYDYSDRTPRDAHPSMRPRNTHPSMIIYYADSLISKVFGPYRYCDNNFDALYSAIVTNDQTDEFDKVINYVQEPTKEMIEAMNGFAKDTGIDKKFDWTFWWSVA